MCLINNIAKLSVRWMSRHAEMVGECVANYMSYSSVNVIFKHQHLTVYSHYPYVHHNYVFMSLFVITVGHYQYGFPRCALQQFREIRVNIKAGIAT
jgi:hypothetical protein